MEVPLLSESELEEFSIEEDGPESALSIPKADDASTVAGMSRSSGSGKCGIGSYCDRFATPARHGVVTTGSSWGLENF